MKSIAFKEKQNQLYIYGEGREENYFKGLAHAVVKVTNLKFAR